MSPCFSSLFVGHVKHKNIVVTLFKVILKGDIYSLWIAIIIGPNFQMGYTLNALSCTRRKWLVCWDLYLLALSLIVYKTWVKFNTWCKAFVQHGYVLRDNYIEILSCPLKHCDFFKVMKSTLILEIYYFINQIFSHKLLLFETGFIAFIHASHSYTLNPLM